MYLFLYFFHSAGEHGYNNSLPSMHPFFIAMGPAFKSGAKVDTFNIVDIYPLMCKLLGLKPAPNNGSLDVVSQLLIDDNESGSATFGACKYHTTVKFHLFDHFVYFKSIPSLAM